MAASTKSRVGRIYLAIFLLFTVLTIGVGGFMLLEKYSFSEAFYMTIITLSTVGFKEVRELSDQGRIFTSFLIITNIGIFAYGITTVTSFIIEGEYRQLFKMNVINQKIAGMKNHVIICGFGRNGKEIADELVKIKQPFLIIEKDVSIIEQFANNSDYVFIYGDATHDDILQKANVSKASSFITTLPSDADNVFVVLSVREYNQSINVISRSSDENSEPKLKKAGANEVVNPEKIGGIHMASLAIHPEVLEFTQLLMSNEGPVISFEQFDFDNISDDYKNKSIRDLEIRSKTGANVIGLKNAKGDYIINPDADTIISPHCKLIILGNDMQIDSFKRKVLKK